MSKFVITGGKPLRGEITVSGSKNAAVGILPAVLLADAPCIIENVPNISDVNVMLDILCKLGATCERISGDVVRIDPTGVTSHEATFDEMARLRGSYYFMGALLGKFGKAVVAQPGGCQLGTRPIDQHLKGFQALGVSIEEGYDRISFNAKKEDSFLIGSNIYLDVVSVGATINLMIVACRASGQTIIENCAKEPHVVDVANFLNSMGAKIRGAGTDTIKITGVPHMRGGITYSIIPDQIEAGTFLIAGAATGGDLTVRNIIPKHQEALTAKLQEMNVGIEEGEDWIRVYFDGPICAAQVKTSPYPGFPTDLQPQISVLLSIADGMSKVTENVSDSRFHYIEEIKRMGAEITVAGKMALISGKQKYRAASVRCHDLRAGAALVIAGLVAYGQTYIHDIHLIDRGYENLEGKLSSVGADIFRIVSNDSGEN